MQSQNVLEIDNLYKYFPVPRSIWELLRRAPMRQVRAVDGVTLHIRRGEILALVGESGSGKTTLARAILGLEPPTRGRVLLDGYDVTEWAHGYGPTVEQSQLAQYRARERQLMLGRHVQMIFQDPYETLNPRQRVFELVAEPLVIHGLVSSHDEKAERVRRALETCGLEPAEYYWDRVPAEMSGGQRQRVVIASALVLEPELIVADEPVSMLDVSIRADILNLLHALRETRNITILYITHDLATAAYFSDRTAVMYQGRIVEMGPTSELFSDPQHPYTRALLSVIPPLHTGNQRERIILEGEVPDPVNIASGCRFHPRCPIAIAECRDTDPHLQSADSVREVACIRVQEIQH